MLVIPFVWNMSMNKNLRCSIESILSGLFPCVRTMTGNHKIFYYKSRRMLREVCGGLGKCLIYWELYANESGCTSMVKTLKEISQPMFQGRHYQTDFAVLEKNKELLSLCVGPLGLEPRTLWLWGYPRFGVNVWFTIYLLSIYSGCTPIRAHPGFWAVHISAAKLVNRNGYIKSFND